MSKWRWIFLLAVCTLLNTIGLGQGVIEWKSPARRGGGAKAPAELPDGTIISVNNHHTTDGVELMSYRSTDCGTTWTAGGLVASDSNRRTDLGDAHVMTLRSGELLCAYRHNQVREREFSLKVASSKDGGFSWQPHSVVAETSGTRAGLWSTFILEKVDGTLQCYYDDEITPHRHGYERHQWLTMKTWNRASSKWENPVTVSRAFNPAHLSRDGMCSVVELTTNSLVCVFETVDVKEPHKGEIRMVTSQDGGASWSWRKAERPLVYRPADHDYSALAPWLVRMDGDRLCCVFVTDEDREVPDTPSTGKLDQDVKAVYSPDGGVTWDGKPQLISNAHPCYLPGIIRLKSGPCRGRYVVQYLSHYVPWTRMD